MQAAQSQPRFHVMLCPTKLTAHWLWKVDAMIATATLQQTVRDIGLQIQTWQESLRDLSLRVGGSLAARRKLDMRFKPSSADRAPAGLAGGTLPRFCPSWKSCPGQVQPVKAHAQVAHSYLPIAAWHRRGSGR